jgi:hypothetical protein
MEEFKVVCINDRNRPKEIPQAFWIEKNEIYTVTEVAELARQRNIKGYKLAEVSIPSGLDYEYYLANRFRLYDEDDANAELAVEELLEETLELVEL